MKKKYMTFTRINKSFTFRHFLKIKCSNCLSHDKNEMQSWNCIIQRTNYLKENMCVHIMNLIMFL